MNEAAATLELVSDVVPSITKVSASLETDLPQNLPSNRRETYVPPRLEDLGSIEITAFESSLILR